jgi:hypothetical protein
MSVMGNSSEFQICVFVPNIHRNTKQNGIPSVLLLERNVRRRFGLTYCLCIHDRRVSQTSNKQREAAMFLIDCLAYYPTLSSEAVSSSEIQANITDHISRLLMSETQIRRNGIVSVVSNIKHENPVPSLGFHFILFVGANSTLNKHASWKSYIASGSEAMCIQS